MKHLNILFILAFCACLSCTSEVQQDEETPPAATAPEFSNNLIFHTSFDGGTDAIFAKGDNAIYTAASFDERFNPTKGLGANPFVRLIEGKGKFGDALEFKQKAKEVVFYAADQNMAFDSTSWSGTVSFWMQLDPATDLEPGYCDPIQISDVGYNDAGFWVDFTRENPRDFRLGIICELSIWDPEGKGPNDNPAFLNQLITATEFPFSRETWTHVAMTFSNLNAENASVSFYVNGKLMGARENITDPFFWNEAKANIMLGLSYVGLLDEISVFDKALSAEEVQELYALPKGVTAVLPSS